MEHYSEKDWRDYIKEVIPENKIIEMEEHLINCDDCLQNYLNAVEKENPGEDVEISPDFTEKVIWNIQKIRDVNKNQYRSKIFIYYTAAACITLFLMGQGFFRNLTGGIPKITAEIIHSPVKIEMFFEKNNIYNIFNKSFNINGLLKINNLGRVNFEKKE